jgi:steroid delta-isomerase-like uncharacterized protein
MSEKNKAVVRRVIEDLFNTGDLNIADEIFASDYQDHTPSNPDLSGLENVKRWVNQWREAFPDTRNTVENRIAEGNDVAVRWLTHATHRGEFLGISPTGRQVEVAGYAIFRLEDGKVVESWDTYDVLSLQGQLRTDSLPEEVLQFWFGREGDPGYGEFREEWFRKDENFDREVRDRFGDLHANAAAGELESWKEEPKSCLAFVIVLDQFSRNMFRGDGRTHATDGDALEASKHAVEQAFDRELPPIQRAFLYMPFMHSENVEDQKLSVELFKSLAEEPDAPDFQKYAVGHMEIVERFGRFPHRNAILNRTSTQEEIEFLKQPGSSF